MIDLHTHTTASDGEFTPSELIDLAINKNIKVLSITDHDTIDGLKAAVEYVKNKDILLDELGADFFNGLSDRCVTDRADNFIMILPAHVYYYTKFIL